MKFKKGDIVEFIGTQHYRKPNGKVFFTVKPGVARIDGTVEGAAQPYYLVATYGSESTVKGWVKEDAVQKLKKEIKIEPISFADSKKVKIALINAQKQIQVINWLDQQWIGAFRLIDHKKRYNLAKKVEKDYANKTVFSSNINFLNQSLKAINISNINELNKTAFVATGEFYNFLGEDYKNSSNYLRRGDILLGNNIIAIVLTNGNKSNEIGSTITIKPEVETTKR